MPIIAGAFSADGRRFVTGSLDGTARVWNTSTGDLDFFRLPAQTERRGRGRVCTPDGSGVTAIYSDGRIVGIRSHSRMRSRSRGLV